MVTTKLYRNDTKKVIDVLGLGEIQPGAQVSVTSEYQPVVVIENYPGLVDVLAEEASEPVESTPVTNNEGQNNEQDI